MCKYSWSFDLLGPNATEDGDAVRGNFIRESKTAPTIFVRELLQNTLDARVNGETARVTINFISTSGQIKAFSELHLKPIKKFVESLDDGETIDLEHPTALVVEEFNTSGLTGSTTDHRAKGENECWANFWHRASIPTKTKSLGRAGQGKITFFMASRLSCLFAVTRRINEEQDYAYGKCIFSRCPKVEGDYYQRNFLWGKITGENQPVSPITDGKIIQNIKDAFQLKRERESGVSFIIPYPDPKLTKEKLIEAVISDFYCPVMTKQLSVSIGNVDITATTLNDLAKRYLEDSRQKFLSFIEQAVKTPPESIIDISPDWQETEKIDSTYFKEDQFDCLKTQFNEGEIIAVRFPVKIFPKGSQERVGSVDAFLQYCENFPFKAEDLFIRNGLSIGEEHHLQKNAKNSFALVQITNTDISEFLGYAEEPSHNKWKKTEPEVVKRYDDVGSAIDAIRNAALRLYNAMRGLSEGMYEDIFADILSIPCESGPQKRKRKKKSKGGGAGPEGPKDPIPRKERFYEFYDLDDNSGIGVRSIAGKVLREQLPLRGRLVFAYNLLEGDGDPFACWHPFDFDLSDQRQFSIQKRGISDIIREENVLVFTVDDIDFDLKISGFNPAQQIKVKGDIENEK